MEFNDLFATVRRQAPRRHSPYSHHNVSLKNILVTKYRTGSILEYHESTFTVR